MHDLQTALAESITRVCGVDAADISPTSTLDDLGIDSLTAAELITDLEIRMGQDLPVDVLRRLGRARTVAELETQLRVAFDRDARES